MTQGMSLHAMRGGIRGWVALLLALSAMVVVQSAIVTDPAQSAKFAKPVITVSTVTPTAIEDGNGWVTLSATVEHASSCTFTAKPAVSELPATVPCSNGAVTQVVDLPGNTRKRPAKYTFKVTAIGPGGKKNGRAFRAVVEPGAGGTPGNLSEAVSVVSDGGDGYCALLASSRVDCWGARVSKGGGFGYSEVPVLIAGVGGTGRLSGVTSVVGNDGGYCALLTSHRVDCWGAGEELNVPEPVSGVGGTGTLSGVSNLVTGVGQSFCALLESGEVDCWGDGSYGELGDGAEAGSASPVTVLGPGGVGTLSGVSSLYGGYYSYCAETSTALDCWGFNDQFELGSGELGPDICANGLSCSRAPVLAVGVGGTGSADGVTSLASTGDDGTAGSWCAGLASGAVTCWGWDAAMAGPVFRELAPGDLVYFPQTGAATGVTSVTGSAPTAMGSYCAMVSSGGVGCWRSNQFGQLGNGTSETINPAELDPSRPVDPVSAVSGIDGALSGVTGVTSGEASYCATLTAGGVACWGLNDAGNLGNGSISGPEGCFGGSPCSTIARAVVGVKGVGSLSGVASTASDGVSYCAVLTSGGVDCWGLNDNGGLGDGTLAASAVPTRVLAPLQQ